jgi:hypothetical protein
MSVLHQDSWERAAVASSLFASAAVAGVFSWMHMRAAPWGEVLCLSADAASLHCTACYAGPALALAGIALLLVPDIGRSVVDAAPTPA